LLVGLSIDVICDVLQVWPYLLGYYKFGSTVKDRDQLDESWRQQYENTVSEWLAVEAIVQQQDRETMEANLVKLTSDQAERPVMLTHKDSTLSNDVFESIQSDDLSVPETVQEETSGRTSPATVTTESKTVVPDVKTVLLDAKAVTPESKTVTLESKTMAPGSKTVALESKTMVPDSKTVALDSKAMAPDSKTVALESKTLSLEESDMVLPQSALASLDGTEPSSAVWTPTSRVLNGEHALLTGVLSNDSKGTNSTDDGLGDSIAHGSTSDSKRCDSSDTEREALPSIDSVELADSQHILVTNPTLDMPDSVEHVIDDISRMRGQVDLGCLRSEIVPDATS